MSRPESATAADVIRRCGEDGIELSVENGELFLTKHVIIEDDLVEQIIKHEPEIIKMLGATNAA